MKKTILYTTILAVLITTWLAFKAPVSGISGSVLPADGAEAVWAINSTDSARAVILNTGSFSINIKPGIYKLIVKSKRPYKDILLENQEVKDGQALDVGQIVLEK